MTNGELRNVVVGAKYVLVYATTSYEEDLLDSESMLPVTLVIDGVAILAMFSMDSVRVHLTGAKMLPRKLWVEGNNYTWLWA